MAELWNVGSVSTFIGNLIGWDSISSISGATLDTIVKQNINYIEQYASVTIDNDAISDKYQPPLIKLSEADVLITRESQQGGVDSVRLGELTVSQGNGGSSELAKQLREEALLRLKELQRRVRFARVIAGC